MGTNTVGSPRAKNVIGKGKDSKTGNPNPSYLANGEGVPLSDRVTRIEEKLVSKSEKLDSDFNSLKNRVEDTQRTWKWIVGSILAIIATGIAAGTFIYSIVKDSISNYIHLNDSYYTELISVKDELYNLQKEIYTSKQQALHQ